MNYLHTAEEIIKRIEWDSFEYRIENADLDVATIPTLVITIREEGKKHEMQPFVLLPPHEVSQLARKLWEHNFKIRKSRQSLKRSKFSLKMDVVENYLLKELGGKIFNNMLDVGSNDSFLSKETIRDSFKNNYIGADLTLPASDLRDRNLLISRAELLPFSNESFTYCLCSMLLMNLIFPEKAIKEISRILVDDGELALFDINSRYYKACGFYSKNSEKPSFNRVLNTLSSFYTIKTLGRKNKYIHCYHHRDLYQEILSTNGFNVVKDEEFGVKEEMFDKYPTDESKKSRKSFMKDMQFPPFIYIKARKSNE